VSTPNRSPVLTSLEQQRKLAKDLIRAARSGDAASLARLHAVRSDAATTLRPLKLADAQLAVAREGGFESWPKLVAEFQEEVLLVRYRLIHVQMEPVAFVQDLDDPRGRNPPELVKHCLGKLVRVIAESSQPGPVMGRHRVSQGSVAVEDVGGEIAGW